MCTPGLLRVVEGNVPGSVKCGATTPFPDKDEGLRVATSERAGSSFQAGRPAFRRQAFQQRYHILYMLPGAMLVVPYLQNNKGRF